jgi:hypothetical protein
MAGEKKQSFGLRAEVAEKFQLKKTVTNQVISVAGIVGEIDFTKVTLEEIDAYPKIQEFLDKK